MPGEGALTELRASITPGGSFEEDLEALQRCVAERIRLQGGVYWLIMSSFFRK